MGLICCNNAIGEMFAIFCDELFHHGVCIGIDEFALAWQLEGRELKWFCKESRSLIRGSTDVVRGQELDVRISFYTFKTKHT